MTRITIALFAVLALGCGTASLGATASEAGTGDGSSDGADSEDTGDAMQSSCDGLAPICGPAGDESCCASPMVPGGEFLRSYDGVTEHYTTDAYPASVSSFRLDKYPITVGRFRAFVADYDAWRASGSPASGDGANPRVLGSGWDPSWDASLVASATELAEAVKCNSAYETWTDAPALNEALPINCVTWFELAAFCAWDAGRLPSEAEYNYAAAGGDEQRVFPWGATMPGPNADLINHECWYGGNGPGTCTGVENIAPVGRVAASDGRYGHADLGGNLGAYVFDWYDAYEVPCADCARTIAPTDATFVVGRVLRGGGFLYEASVASQRTPLDEDGNPYGGFGPDYRDYDTGGRCARAL